MDLWNEAPEALPGQSWGDLVRVGGTRDLWGHWEGDQPQQCQSLLLAWDGQSAPGWPHWAGSFPVTSMGSLLSSAAAAPSPGCRDRKGPRAQDCIQCLWNVPREETPAPLCSSFRPQSLGSCSCCSQSSCISGIQDRTGRARKGPGAQQALPFPCDIHGIPALPLLLLFQLQVGTGGVPAQVSCSP